MPVSPGEDERRRTCACRTRESIAIVVLIIFAAVPPRETAIRSGVSSAPNPRSSIEPTDASGSPPTRTSSWSCSGYHDPPTRPRSEASRATSPIDERSPKCRSRSSASVDTTDNGASSPHAGVNSPLSLRTNDAVIPCWVGSAPVPIVSATPPDPAGEPVDPSGVARAVAGQVAHEPPCGSLRLEPALPAPFMASPRPIWDVDPCHTVYGGAARTCGWGRSKDGIDASVGAI